MTKWEYEYMFININDYKKTLNEMGQKGWEICNVYDRGGNTRSFVTFKRPIYEDPFISPMAP